MSKNIEEKTFIWWRLQLTPKQRQEICDKYKSILGIRYWDGITKQEIELLFNHEMRNNKDAKV